MYSTHPNLKCLKTALPMYRTQAILTSKFLSNLEILEAACDKHWSNYLSQTISGEHLHLRSLLITVKKVLMKCNECEHGVFKLIL